MDIKRGSPQPNLIPAIENIKLSLKKHKHFFFCNPAATLRAQCDFFLWFAQPHIRAGLIWRLLFIALALRAHIAIKQHNSRARRPNTKL